MTKRLWFSAIAALLLAAGGCGDPSPNDCADCMECGSADPNHEDKLFMGTWGENEAGAPVIGLMLAKQGKCATDDADFFWLVWDGAEVTVELHESFEGIDNSGISAEGLRLQWGDRELVVDVDGVTALIMDLTFIEGGATTEVRCEASGGALTCSEVEPTGD